ncbi:MAG TPA: hypothetical protein VLX92_03665 [Kofleriaceae bacterium]|nr:hypothetical protein [Kofleriaceae bacterium]
MAVVLVALAARAALADPKREKPDYDGRGNPDAHAGSWVLWIPRVLLWPPYAVDEYLLRRPLGALVTTAERSGWIGALASAATHTGRTHVVPIARFDRGERPAVGADVSVHGTWRDDDVASVGATTWGVDQYAAEVRDRLAYDRGAASLELRAGYARSIDNAFFGLGPDAHVASRFGLARGGAGLGYARRLAPALELAAESGVEHVAFVGGSCCDDPSLADQIARGALAAPPGYGDAYALAHQRAELAVGDPQALGASLRLYGDARFRLDRAGVWVRYGLRARGAIDLDGHHRVLAILAGIDLVDPLQHEAVAFTELASPADELMPAFIPGWMLGRSAAAAQLAYRWPIWVYLDARLRIALGNAFDAHLDDFALGELRASADFSLVVTASHAHPIELVIGAGSDPLDDGVHVATVRVLVGTSTAP